MLILGKVHLLVASFGLSIGISGQVTRILSHCALYRMATATLVVIDQTAFKRLFLVADYESNVR